jgi:hypothetical protein
MLKTSDKLVSKKANIYVSASANYSHKKTTSINVQLVERALPILKTLLKLPSLSIRVAPIKAKNMKGYYQSESKLVTVDCRLEPKELIEVLSHELVHAEQYHSGRLMKKYLKRKGWMHYWNGTIGSKGTTYKAYRDQPWEKEAWGRQEDLAKLVIDKL